MPKSADYIAKILEADLSPQTKKNYECGFRSLVDKSKTTIQDILMHPHKFIPLIRKWFDKPASRPT